MSTDPGTSTGFEPWTTSAGPVHSDLRAAKTRVYDVNGFVCSRPVPEAESADYGAHEFTLDGASVRFRAARTTPTKIGQFVTVWKRSPEGPIQPFDSTDPVDLFVVGSREDQHFGQFVFPREVLCERDVVSRNGIGGKRAFRVYPPWVTAVNRQARAAQAWQLRYFLLIPEDGPADGERARALYHPVARGGP
ncbi:MepB family protein [Streptomyces fildesensis]|uniref:MepB family protein n=1 Tax=Streptomyces fildesensis TaxID=375757 RepID=A0ABW8C721_9ACTN